MSFLFHFHPKRRRRKAIAIHQIGPCEGLPAISHEGGTGHLRTRKPYFVALDSGYGWIEHLVVTRHFERAKGLTIGRFQAIGPIKAHLHLAVGLFGGTFNAGAAGC